MGIPEEGPYNPYEDQTEANTRKNWLYDGNRKNLDADLDGMADYAKNLGIIRDNLQGNVPYLSLLASMPAQAWGPGSLPEGAYTAKLMIANYNELMQYLSFLWQALNNVGSAAQTIAAAYSGTDGWSAADLNSVKFAYGYDVNRPSGYPAAWLNQVKTWQDMYSENMRTGNGAASGVVVQWDEQEPYYDDQGRRHVVAVSSDGIRREIIEYTDRFSGQTSTTTVVTYPPNPNGLTPEQRNGYSQTTRRVETSHYVGNNTVQTNTTNYGPDGNVTGRTTEETQYGRNGQVTSTTTQNFDPNNNKTTGTSTVTNPDGSQTITTTRGNETDRTVQIGEQTEGQIGLGETPAQDKVNELRPR